MRILVVLLALLASCAAPGPRLARSPWERPPSSSAEVRRATARALEAGDPQGVTHGLVQLAEMGASLTAETQARLAPLIEPDLMPRRWNADGYTPAQHLADQFTFNASRLAESEPLTEVPVEHRLVEGIAWDAATERLFVGSVVDRRVLVRDGGAWREVALAGPAGGLFGMAVDPARRLLWVASAPAEQLAGSEAAFSGIIALDLDEMVEARRIEVPDARLGDVAVASDGTVYASDGRSGAIHRCRPGCIGTELLIPPGLLRSPQGMALDRHERILFVADYSLGLLRVELDSRIVTPLIVRAPQMLEGIDGLVRIGPSLVAVQNGTAPRRIIRIDLDRGGRFVERVTPIERNVEGWGEPTLAAVRGDGLVYVADSQWEQYGPGGRLADGAPSRPTSIRWIREVWDEILIGGHRSADLPG